MSKQNRKVLIGGVGVLLLIAVIAVAIAVPLSKNKSQTDFLEDAKRILTETPIVDGHNDLPYQLRAQFNNRLGEVDLNSDLSDITDTDIPRLRTGKVGGQFWACYSFCETQFKDAIRVALEQIDVIKRFTAQYSDTFEFVTTSAGLKDAINKGKIASLIGVEGGHMIDSSFGVLRMLYDLGSRYMTLTHSCHTTWADTASVDATYGGLTDFGKKIILEMNRLGMMADISHVSADAMRDVLSVSVAPVIFSHSSAMGICDHDRNVPDDVIDRMPDNGGIIMINFYNNYVTCTPKANVSDVADHFDYIKARIGTTHLGIGGDYDGVPRLPEGLSDVSMYPNLIAELLSRGWTETEIKAIANENILRVFSKVEEVATSMKAILPDDSLIPDEELKQNNTCRTD